MGRMFTFTLLAALFVLSACSNKVKLKDVSTLTLYRGEYTTARRSAAVPQIKCIGGSAKERYEPKVVQCYNRGFDGDDVQWECKTEMPNDFEFGKIRVSCEGYDYPEDPYVLKGSCGLEYELDYTSGGAGHHGDDSYPHGSTHSEKKHHEGSNLTSPRDGFEGDRNRGGSGGSPPFPPSGPGPRGAPPPPGFKTNFDAPPPTYDEACRRGTTHRSGTHFPGGDNQPSSSSGPGLFTGLGLGGLAGYAFGRMRDSGSSYFRQRGPTQYERDSGFFSEQPSTSQAYRTSASSSSSSKTKTTSGFGGTVRR